MELSDPRLLRAIQELIDRRAHALIRERVPITRYGIVAGAADTGSRTVAVRLYGQDQPAPGFVYGEVTPVDGDHVRVSIDVRGDRYVDAVLGRDPITEALPELPPSTTGEDPIDRALHATAQVAVPTIDTGVSDDQNLLHGTVTDGGPTTHFTNPERANDGDPASSANAGAFVHSAGTYYRRLKTDLGSSYTVGQMVIVGNIGGADPQWLVWSSSDGVSWSLVTTTHSWASGTSTITFTPVSARYWRIGWEQTWGSGLGYVPLLGVKTWAIIGASVILGDDALVPAPETVDADDATFHVSELAEAVRIDLGTAYRIVRGRVLIGCASAGSKSYALRAAASPDFSDEVTLTSWTFTAAGAYATNELTAVWAASVAYRYFRLVGPAESRRIFTVELYEQAANQLIVTNPVTGLQDEIDDALAAIYAAETDHIAEATDAHDASAVSYDNTASGLIADQVQAAIDELASGTGGGGAVAVKEGGSTVVAVATAVNAGHGLDVTDETGGVAGLAVDESELEISTVRKTLTNKSGGSVAAGDVVVISAATADAFTTTTVAQATMPIGVAMESIANNAAGLVALAGYVPLVNVPAGVTLRHYAETNGTAKQATGNSTRRAGSFGVFLTGSTTPDAILFGAVDDRQDLTGYVLKSTLTAKGQLLGASASATPAAVAAGTNGDYLIADSSQTAGTKFAARPSRIPFHFEGGGAALSVGMKCYLPDAPGLGITQATGTCDTGTITFEFKKCSQAGYPGSLASITGSAGLAITAGNKVQDSTLSGWTTTITDGDVIECSITATSGSPTRAAATLRGTRS